MTNLYRNAARPEPTALPPGTYDYAAKIEHDKERARRHRPVRWAWRVFLFTFPGALVWISGGSFTAGLQAMLLQLAQALGFVLVSYAFGSVVLAIYERVRETRNFFTDKLAADTERFLAEQEEHAMKTRVFLRPAKPGARPQEITAA